jgi:hypothetical protein
MISAFGAHPGAKAPWAVERGTAMSNLLVALLVLVIGKARDEWHSKSR